MLRTNSIQPDYRHSCIARLRRSYHRTGLNPDEQAEVNWLKSNSYGFDPVKLGDRSLDRFPALPKGISGLERGKIYSANVWIHIYDEPHTFGEYNKAADGDFIEWYCRFLFFYYQEMYRLAIPTLKESPALYLLGTIKTNCWIMDHAGYVAVAGDYKRDLTEGAWRPHYPELDPNSGETCHIHWMTPDGFIQPVVPLQEDAQQAYPIPFIFTWRLEYSRVSSKAPWSTPKVTGVTSTVFGGSRERSFGQFLFLHNELIRKSMTDGSTKDVPQVSHRCMNARCMCPFHLCLDSRVFNQSREFCFGGCHCIHFPLCLCPGVSSPYSGDMRSLRIVDSITGRIACGYFCLNSWMGLISRATQEAVEKNYSSIESMVFTMVRDFFRFSEEDFYLYQLNSHFAPTMGLLINFIYRVTLPHIKLNRSLSQGQFEELLRNHYNVTSGHIVKFNDQMDMGNPSTYSFQIPRDQFFFVLKREDCLDADTLERVWGTDREDPRRALPSVRHGYTYRCWTTAYSPQSCVDQLTSAFLRRFQHGGQFGGAFIGKPIGPCSLAFLNDDVHELLPLFLANAQYTTEYQGNLCEVSQQLIEGTQEPELPFTVL